MASKDNSREYLNAVNKMLPVIEPDHTPCINPMSHLLLPSKCCSMIPFRHTTNLKQVAPYILLKAVEKIDYRIDFSGLKWSVGE